MNAEAVKARGRKQQFRKDTKRTKIRNKQTVFLHLSSQEVRELNAYSLVQPISRGNSISEATFFGESPSVASVGHNPSYLVLSQSVRQ